MLSLDEVINGDLNVLTESSAKRLAEHMDTNKDGTIDYDEFIRATEPDVEQLNDIWRLTLICSNLKGKLA